MPLVSNSAFLVVSSESLARFVQDGDGDDRDDTDDDEEDEDDDDEDIEDDDWLSSFCISNSELPFMRAASLEWPLVRSLLITHSTLFVFEFVVSFLVGCSSLG